MSINPPSDYDDNEPLARVAHGVEALCAAWRQLPPPVKWLAGVAALALAAPALRRTADSLAVEPKELLQLIQGT